MDQFIWQDGSFESGEWGAPLNARGFTHGLGVFETMLAVDGRLVAPEAHFERLEGGCGRLGLLLEVGLQPAIESLLKPRGRQRVRLQVASGAGRLGCLDQGRAWVTLEIAEAAEPPKSVKAVWSPWPRNERSALVGLKSTSYAENLVALDHARRLGADTAIFLNTRRDVCEAATANVFVVTGKRVKTPPLDAGCLPGTARERVLDLARMLGLEAVETGLKQDDVELADEVFLTSAIQGVVPVEELDGKSMATGKVARSLQQVFQGK